MTLNQFSRQLYRAARMARDAQAVNRSLRTGSVAPIGKRLLRKAVYRFVGGLLGRGMR